MTLDQTDAYEVPEGTVRVVPFHAFEPRRAPTTRGEIPKPRNPDKPDFVDSVDCVDRPDRGGRPPPGRRPKTFLELYRARW